jgi:hypothetical protein
MRNYLLELTIACQNLTDNFALATEDYAAALVLQEIFDEKRFEALEMHS